MVATVAFNPFTMTNAAGTFNVQSTGFICGTAEDDPVARYALQGGYLAVTETLPMWGGVGVAAAVPSALSTAPDVTLGPIITRATTLTAAASGQLVGFSVFDQNYSAINTPQSAVPLVGSYGQVNWYPIGSGARLKVAIDPSLISFQTTSIASNVSWDFTNQRLQPYAASGATEAVTSMTWSATNGGQVAVVMAAPSIFGLGDTITVAGVTNTGTAAVSTINTAQVINTYTDTTHFTFLLPGTSTLYGTFGGTITIGRGVGALNVKVLEILIGNSMTVNYNATTGAASWNRNDSAAIILI